MKDCDQLDILISEYSGLAQRTTINGRVDLDTERLANILSTDHEWTRQGANTVVSLATDYGAFVLRNALALAIALHIEDGLLEL